MGFVLVIGLMALVAGVYCIWRVQADYQQASRYAENTARLDGQGDTRL